MFRINVRAYALNPYIVGQSWFSNFFGQWGAVQHDRSSRHAVLTFQLPLLLPAWQTSPMSCHAVVCTHPCFARCTLRVLPCLFLGINHLAPSSAMPVTQCSHSPWWTSSPWTPRCQAWQVHSVSVYGVCDQPGMEGTAHTTAQRVSCTALRVSAVESHWNWLCRRCFVLCLLSSCWRTLSAQQTWHKWFGCDGQQHKVQWDKWYWIYH